MSQLILSDDYNLPLAEHIGTKRADFAEAAAEYRSQFPKLELNALHKTTRGRTHIVLALAKAYGINRVDRKRLSKLLKAGRAADLVQMLLHLVGFDVGTQKAFAVKGGPNRLSEDENAAINFWVCGCYRKSIQFAQNYKLKSAASTAKLTPKQDHREILVKIIERLNFHTNLRNRLPMLPTTDAGKTVIRDGDIRAAILEVLILRMFGVKADVRPVGSGTLFNEHRLKFLMLIYKTFGSDWPTAARGVSKHLNCRVGRIRSGFTKAEFDLVRKRMR